MGQLSTLLGKLGKKMAYPATTVGKSQDFGKIPLLQSGQSIDPQLVLSPIQVGVP